MVYLIILIIICLALLPYSLSRSKTKSIKNSDKLVQSFISDNNLTVTKSINIPGYGDSGYFFIDDNKKCINYLVWKKSDIKNFSHRTFNYKDVLSCQLIKDEKTSTVKNILESLDDNTNKEEYVKKLGIRINLNDLSCPYIDILLLNSTEANPISSIALTINLVDQWLAAMNIVIQKGKEKND
ncbi:hypothetical protein [Clostridium akagii]|uniref:hypothetical protein n=1 Tax=Clostridium akagii TaxID=91623 RepID=UPI00047D0CAC|nr:hypothetical protein [Clostridium akagii]